ncbi:MAG: hypothetical protein ACOC2F_01250 [Bacteroidota bacterium]
MISLTKYTVTLLTVFLFLQGDGDLHRSWKQLHEQENVSIHYKWRHSNPFIPDSPLRLKVLLKNDNPYRVTVSFAVDYYHKALFQETSDVLSFCVNQESALTGRFRGLVYSPGGFSNEEIRSELFEVDVSEVDVEKDQDCRLKINWMGINEFLSETDTSYVE